MDFRAGNPGVVPSVAVVMSRVWALVIVALAAAACAKAQPSWASGLSTGQPAAAAPVGSSSTVVTSPSDEPAASGGQEPWWVTGVSACGSPAVYRVGHGQPLRLGDCAALLLTPPADVRVAAGAEVDLHVTTDATSRPIYPLPGSPDASVLRLVERGDNGATGRYLAVGDGEVVLMTSGLCLDTASGQESTGPCPVLRIAVGP